MHFSLRLSVWYTSSVSVLRSSQRISRAQGWSTLVLYCQRTQEGAKWCTDEWTWWRIFLSWPPVKPLHPVRSNISLRIRAEQRTSSLLKYSGWVQYPKCCFFFFLTTRSNESQHSIINDTLWSRGLVFKSYSQTWGIMKNHIIVRLLTHMSVERVETCLNSISPEVQKSMFGCDLGRCCSCLRPTSLSVL